MVVLLLFWAVFVPPVVAAVLDVVVEVLDVVAAAVAVDSELSPMKGVSARTASGPIPCGAEGAGERKTRYMRRQKLRSMAKMIK